MTKENKAFIAEIEEKLAKLSLRDQRLARRLIRIIINTLAERE